MPNEVEPRQVKRGQHVLPQARWRVILIITDTPSPGETYLTKDEIVAEFEKSVDLPAGISFEVGTIEKAAAGSDGK